MLEDLCLQSVAGDPAMDCVEEYFGCLQKAGVSPRNLPKAKMQAFLASREKAGLRLGEGAEKGYFDWENPTFNELREFLHSL